MGTHTFYEQRPVFAYIMAVPSCFQVCLASASKSDKVPWRINRTTFCKTTLLSLDLFYSMKTQGLPSNWKSPWQGKSTFAHPLIPTVHERHYHEVTLYVEILKQSLGKSIGTIALMFNCMWAFCLWQGNCQVSVLPRHIFGRNFPQIIAQNEFGLPCQSDESS